MVFWHRQSTRNNNDFKEISMEIKNCTAKSTPGSGVRSESFNGPIKSFTREEIKIFRSIEVSLHTVSSWIHEEGTMCNDIKKLAFFYLSDMLEEAREKLLDVIKTDPVFPKEENNNDD